MIAAATRRAGSARLAVVLLWLTVLYNTFEGIVAVSSGLLAGSVALVGFGLDSFIEVTAAAILLWRLGLHVTDARVEGRERLARRVVGATFVVLAVYIGLQTAYVLTVGDEPEPSRVGLALAVTSLALMPLLGLTKRWNARRMHSHALMAESTETLICSYLSVALLVGLGANALFGWWWADIAAALAMVPWILKEGVEGLRAEGCGEDCE
jgi:divalent metal cation (Fe/Co/Zn/Cd) transporter